MKIRNGFVSNSSSSSFVINKRYLSRHQIEQIHNHIEVSREWIRFDWCDEPWAIEEDEHLLVGSVWMDNFPMDEFLRRIGVDEDHVWWEEY